MLNRYLCEYSYCISIPWNQYSYHYCVLVSSTALQQNLFKLWKVQEFYFKVWIKFINILFNITYLFNLYIGGFFEQWHDILIISCHYLSYISYILNLSLYFMSWKCLSQLPDPQKSHCTERRQGQWKHESPTDWGLLLEY